MFLFILSENNSQNPESIQNLFLDLHQNIKQIAMKNVIFISFALMIGFSACGQKLKEKDVPAAVKAKFTSLYPNVTDVDWSKEHGAYEAEFDVNKNEASVNIDSLGNLIETENEIEVSALPAAVNTYFSSNVPGEKIKEAAKMTDAKGVVTYEAEVKGADYIFDAQGNFIKKSENKEKD